MNKRLNLKKRVMALALTLSVFWAVMSAMAVAVPGSVDDPLITLGYMLQVFTPKMLGEASARAKVALDAENERLNALMRDKQSELNKGLIDKAASKALTDAVNARVSQAFTNTGGKLAPVSAAPDKTLTLAAGSSLTLLSGSAVLSGYAAVDLSAGGELPDGSTLPLNHELMFFDSGGAVTFSAVSSLLVSGSYALTSPAYIPKYTDLALALKEMGLLRGSGSSGFALARPATRAEALYMMLYLMGEITAAEAYAGTSPFSDVPQWASAAVSYAYDKGYTKGVSATLFGSEQISTPEQYVTMLLRVMGYDDSSGEFSWDKSLDFAVSRRMLTAAEREGLISQFYRDQMVYVSYYSLDALTKDGVFTLEQALVSRGTLTAEKVASARGKVSRSRGLQ